MHRREEGSVKILIMIPFRWWYHGALLSFLKFTFLLFYNTMYYFYISMFTYLPKVSHAVFKLKIIALDFPNLCDMPLCLALMMQSLKGNPILTASFNLLIDG